MNLDLTKYLGEYGAAIAAMGVMVVAWLNNRTSHNLNTKISNMKSELLQLAVSSERHEAMLNELRCNFKALQYEFDDYRRTHP